MTKPHTHSFRCTPETSERLKAAAKAAGLAQGDYIAQLLDRLDEFDRAAEYREQIANHLSEEPNSPHKAVGDYATSTNPTVEDVLRSTAEANGVDPDLAVIAATVTRGEPTPGELHIDLAERVDRAELADTRLEALVLELTKRVDELEHKMLPAPEEYRPPAQPLPPLPCVCGAPTTPGVAHRTDGPCYGVPQGWWVDADGAMP